MQPLALRLPLGAGRIARDVVRVVLDAPELDLLERAAVRERVPGRRLEARKAISSTGPPVNASPSTSRPVALVQSNGSIDSRPLKTQVSANTPKKAPGT